MEQINNKDVIKEVANLLKYQPEVLPGLDTSKINLNADVTPDFHRICNYVDASSLTNATSVSFATLPSSKDFYLVGATLNVEKDVTSTSTSTRLNATIGGVSQILLIIGGITLTAQNQSVSISLPVPMKIDRGTAVTITNTSGVANIISSGSIIGYFVDIN